MESLCPAPGLVSWVVPGQGLLGEARLGRPLLSLWAASPLFVVGRPCACPGGPRARIRGCRFARLVSAFERLGGGRDAIHRLGCAPRLLRGGDRGGRPGAARREARVTTS